MLKPSLILPLVGITEVVLQGSCAGLRGSQLWALRAPSCAPFSDPGLWDVARGRQGSSNLHHASTCSFALPSLMTTTSLQWHGHT